VGFQAHTQCPCGWPTLSILSCICLRPTYQSVGAPFLRCSISQGWDSQLMAQAFPSQNDWVPHISILRCGLPSSYPMSVRMAHSFNFVLHLPSPNVPKCGCPILAMFFIARVGFPTTGQGFGAASLPRAARSGIEPGLADWSSRTTRPCNRRPCESASTAQNPPSRRGPGKVSFGTLQAVQGRGEEHQDRRHQT
jgi:hypothetical protein